MSHPESLEDLARRCRAGDRFAAALLRQELAEPLQIRRLRETRLERERQRRVLESYRQGNTWAQAQAAASFDEGEWLIEHLADRLCDPATTIERPRAFDPQADTWRD